MLSPATSAEVSALLGVYARVGPVFVAGEGSELIAEDGTRYLDFVAGIAVNALGYNSPVIRESVLRALDSGLIHVSNLYRTEPGERLAAELTKSFRGGGAARRSFAILARKRTRARSSSRVNGRRRPTS